MRRRDVLILVPIAVIASGLAFDLGAYVSGGIIWSFRYCIAAVPLGVALVGVLIAGDPLRVFAGKKSAKAPSADQSVGAAKCRSPETRRF